MIQRRVYRTTVQDVNELRQRIIDMWAGVEQSVIDDVSDKWRRRFHVFLYSSHRKTFRIISVTQISQNVATKDLVQIVASFLTFTFLKVVYRCFEVWLNLK